MLDAPVRADLVLVGGGHTHVEVLRRFGMRPEPGVRITLVGATTHTPYSGMLPGLIAGHYTFDDTHIDLRPLARFAGARFFPAEAMGLDLAGRRVLCRDRPPVRYDLLSLDIGSTPETADVPGAAEHAVPVKPISRFLARWERLAGRVAAAGPLRIGVVGAGAGGVEILLAVQHRLRARAPEMHLFAGGGVLPDHSPRVRARFARVLAERGVRIHAERVVQVEAGAVVDAAGARWPLDEVLWVTTARGAPWLAASGLAVDGRGFVQVDATLRSLSRPEVFACGDVAAVVPHPRPKAGVFAVRQGPPLAENLRRVLRGEPPEPFVPQRRFLALITTGDRHAVASRGRLAVEGDWVWRWKDRIDRRFMARYADLPAMAPELPAAGPGAPAAAMRCGGCGAKVGASVLARVLRRLGLPAAPEDAAVVEVPRDGVVLQSVDHFRAFVDDPYVFGRIAAEHALSDLYACGATPRTALAIATLPHAAEAVVEDRLFQLLAGALDALRGAGVALVGGHSGEGAEMALGFAVQGTAEPGRLLRKGGLRGGDALVLTKALGTGALLAAEMRGQARGRWIDEALAAMQRSNRAAADLLGAHGATACTDVTGFGLAGHLLEMLEASGAAADLDLDAVPLLDGAAEVVAAGVASTMLPQNLRLAAAAVDGCAGDARRALLFDPQTAGGLLAGVPAAAAEACVQALRDAGYPDAAVIGRVRPARSDPALRVCCAERPPPAEAP